MKKLLTLLLSVFLTATLSAQTITVTNLNDSGAGSFRQAVADAVAGGTVDFAVTGVINTNSTILVDKSLTITGPGKDDLTISGGFGIELLNTIGAVTVEISGMTFTQGQNSAINVTPNGSLTIVGCRFENNSSQNSGGAINVFSDATLTVNRCEFLGNTATNGFNDGGAIFVSSAGEATIANSIFTQNTAAFGGGAIATISGSLTLERVWEFYSLNAWYLDKIIEQLAKYKKATELSTVCS